MRVLITQPAQEAASSARALAARGHDPIVIPLVTVARESPGALNLSGAQGFLATSAEAVRALADRVGVRTFPLFVDSDLTAAEARRAGFKDIHPAKDDAQDLARLVERTLKPANGALIYACSTNAPVNLPTMLGNMGFAVRPLPLYSVKRVETLPALLREKLANTSIDAAIFLSPDEARAFVTLVQRDGTAPGAGFKTVAATPAVAAPLRALKGTSVTVAAASDPDTIWATLDGNLVDRVEGERLARERREREDALRAEADAARRAAQAAEAAEKEQRARAKAVADQRERERIETERADAARTASEQIAAERAEKAERERAEGKRRKAEESARAKTERERLAAEQAEQERLRREEEARARAEQEQRKAEEAARAKAEKERLATEQAEHERLRREEEARARAEQEQREAEEAARAKAEKERLAAEQAEHERLRREDEARARAEQKQDEAERLARDKAEQARRVAEAGARIAAEQERLAAERAAWEAAETVRLAAAKAEHERLDAERIAREVAAAEKRAQEQAAREAREAAARAQHEKDRLAREALAREDAERRRRAQEEAVRAREAARRDERERRGAEKAARAAQAAVKKADTAERKRLARLEAEAKKTAAEAARREAAARSREEQERLAREHVERKAAAPSFGARLGALFTTARTAPDTSPTTNSRWTMTVAAHDAREDHPASPVAAAAATWNDKPMNDPNQNPEKSTPSSSDADNAANQRSATPIPSALLELDALVERENATNRVKDGAASREDVGVEGKPNTRSGGRSARMQVEDAADERAADRLRNWGRSEPSQAEASPHPEPADAASPEAMSASPRRKRGAGRSIALFFVLASVIAVGVMTVDRWWPLITGIDEAPVAQAPSTGPATSPPPAPATPPPAPAGSPAPPAPTSTPVESAPVVSAPVTAAATSDASAPVDLAADEAGLAPALTGQAQQIAALTARIATLEAALGNVARLEEINARVVALEDKSADAASVLALSDRVLNLESGARTLADQRSTAIAQIIAATQWREAVVTGRPFQKEWDAVAAMNPGAGAQTGFAAHAGAGLPTLADLQRRFGPMAAAVVRAGIIPRETSGWARRTLDRALSIVTIRRTDADVGDDVDAILVRAERAVTAANLPGAVSELNKLTGAALVAAQPWIDLATARIAAEQAVQGAVMAAVVGLAAQPSAANAPARD